jgi:8-oxo-dGTP diphosphatase
MAKIDKKYKFAVIATDVVIFTVLENKLQVLLIKMKKAPFAGYWAVPGGIIKADESIDAAAKRHLFVKSGVKNVYLEQLHSFGEVGRDPLGRVVSVAYFALIPDSGLKLKTTPEYGQIKWFAIDKLPKLAYDHREIIGLAVRRLQSKLGYTNIVYGLLPPEFTLPELQKTYEIILEKKLDKRNFRKKILSVNLLLRVGKKRGGEANRPAELYRFASNNFQPLKML